MHGCPRLAFIFDNAGVDEWLVIGAVAFIVFGPQRLPEIARTIGRVLARLRHAADDFKAQMSQFEREVRRETELPVSGPPLPAPPPGALPEPPAVSSAGQPPDPGRRTPDSGGLNPEP
jgi:Tat protein translocase TatB subunit